MDYAGETTGFGAIEWRTFRDLMLRPRDVLNAYLERGPSGGGVYARPMGFYIALCSLLMFYMFLMGGLKGTIEQQPAETLNLWIAKSGKSRDVFIDDADGWMSLVAVPILSIFYALFAAPFIRWWTKFDWRRSFRSTFAFLCAWTVPITLLGPLPMVKGFEAISAVLMYGASMVAFLRMGRGLWWTGWVEGMSKATLLTIVLSVAAWVGMIPIFNIGLLGALYGN